MELCKVTINGITKEYPKGITYQEISKDYRDEFKTDIILVMMNGRLRELFKRLKEDCTLEFITVAQNDGMKTYERGMVYLMIRALYRVIGHDQIEKVRVEHSIGRSFYCELDGSAPIDPEIMEQAKLEMQSMVKRDIPFQKRSVATVDAAALFHQYGMYDKEQLFQFRRVSSANLYELDGFEDYFYGYMPPSTGFLKVFNLMCYEDGFVLMLPSRSEERRVGKEC